MTQVCTSAWDLEYATWQFMGVSETPGLALFISRVMRSTATSSAKGADARLVSSARAAHVVTELRLASTIFSAAAKSTTSVARVQLRASPAAYRASVALEPQPS